MPLGKLLILTMRADCTEREPPSSFMGLHHSQWMARRSRAAAPELGGLSGWGVSEFLRGHIERGPLSSLRGRTEREPLASYMGLHHSRWTARKSRFPKMQNFGMQGKTQGCKGTLGEVAHPYSAG